MTKVLVFEGQPVVAAELRRELGRLGATVQVVEDGEVGLKVAATDRPDLILPSIELPGGNGFAVCNKLKKHPQLKDVPLVIMSSEESEETFEQHRKLRTRADDYVHTPIAFGELLRHIGKFLPQQGGPFRVPGAVPNIPQSSAPAVHERAEQRLVGLAPKTWQRLETLAIELRDKSAVGLEPMQLAALLLENSIEGLTGSEIELVVRRRRAVD